MLRKLLNVAEKPSIAKAVTRILSKDKFRTRSGYSQGTPVHEFEYNIEGENVRMVFTSVLGHIMDTEFVSPFNEWNSCHAISLFDKPIERHIKKDLGGIKKTLQDEILRCDGLICWLDCDREGENISFEVIDICTEKKSDIVIKRARFSSLEREQILHAIQNLTVPNRNDSDAVDARQEIDLRIGAAFTRFQTKQLRQTFPNLNFGVCSYGPCQFPTLGFVVEQWRKVQKFVPQDYWTLEVIANFELDSKDTTKNKKSSHSKEDSKKKKKTKKTQEEKKNEEVIFKWSKEKLFVENIVMSIAEKLQKNSRAEVKSITTKTRVIPRPKPLETIELQKRASQYLQFSSLMTMKLAESLYQQGFISYPRTETDQFSEGNNHLQELIRFQSTDRRFHAFINNSLQQGFLLPSQGFKNDGAHPPIHPIQSLPRAIGQQGQLYELIVRHFLACFGEDAQRLQTEVTIEIDGETFILQGYKTIKKGFLEIYDTYEKWEDKIIPKFTIGQIFTPDAIDIKKGRTQAPPLLSEEELIGLMDKHGIGTDATMATHISTIQTRGYAIKNDMRRFVPTDLGIGLCDAYDRMQLNLYKPDLRANMEAQMKQISEGKLDKTTFVKNCIREMKKNFITFQTKAHLFDEAIRDRFERKLISPRPQKM